MLPDRNGKYKKPTLEAIPLKPTALKCDCDGIKVIGSRAGRNPTRALSEVKKMH
jgi:hypothetical protein